MLRNIYVKKDINTRSQIFDTVLRAMVEDILSPSTIHDTQSVGQGYDYTIGPTQTLPNAASDVPNSRIYEQSLISKENKVSLSSYAFLFQSIISYHRDSSKNVQEIERKLNALGYNIGIRLTELLNFRDSVPAKTGSSSIENVASAITNMKRRHLKILETLQYIHLTVWQYLFSRPSNDLVKSSERDNEYMIIDNEPTLSQFIQHTSVQCESLTCGIIEGFLDMAGFSCHVTSHFVEEDGFANRTVYLIQFDKEVVEREALRQ